jgi:H+/Cl- antiporter ClcA
VGTYALGGLLGGLVGGLFVVGVTVGLKALMDLVSSQDVAWMLLVPLIGLALTVLVLQVFGRREGQAARAPRASAWRTFPPGAIQADITGDVVATAGEEERFPWRLAPLRTVAIVCTVGLGQAMGTEAPAAYLGAAAGACLGDRGRRWRRLLRPAALGGGAAGVSALMAIPLMGTAYMLELGHRHRVPLRAERVVAALVGGFVGWGIQAAFGLDLIRLVVPKVPPGDLAQAVIAAVLIGGLSGGITSIAASAIYGAKKWGASPSVRLAVGGIVAGLTAMTLVLVASPAAAVGPGGGAILWAEGAAALPRTLLAVAVLRAVATTAAVAAGGCGGVFVPFLAVGDLAGRVFAPGLGVGADLAGAAGAAGGIAGGYRLPFTAAAMVLAVGGPRASMWTCFATVVFAYLAGTGAAWAVSKLPRLPRVRRRAHGLSAAHRP